MTKEEKRFKEFLLRTLIQQGQTKIKSIEGWQKQKQSGDNLGYNIPAIIEDKVKDLEVIQTEAQKIAKELGLKDFDWSKEIKKED